MFLLCRCGGLQVRRDELHGMGVGRYGLGGLFWMMGMGGIRV